MITITSNPEIQYMDHLPDVSLLIYEDKLSDSQISHLWDMTSRAESDLCLIL
jgi:hypothetical protein